MIPAFTFLLTRSLKNFVRWRLRRLRQPRYLAATLAGGLYIWMTWARHVVASNGRGAKVALGPALGQHRDIVELMATLGLALTVAVAWALPQSGAALRFTAAEVQFLFTAPVSRRRLVQFRLLRSQLVLLLGIAVGSLAFGGRAFRPELWPLTLGACLVLLTLNLHFTGIALLRTNLIHHGVSAIRRSLTALAVIAAIVVVAALGTRGAVPALRQALAPGGDALLATMVRVAHQGALGLVLAPLRAMIRPALAADMVEFARLAWPALGILALNYAWVVRSDAAFEEAAAEAAARRAVRLEQRRSGHGVARVRVGVGRRPPFPLAPEGRPEIAVVWKNLIATGRHLEPRMLLRLLAVALVPFVVATQVAHADAPWRVAAVVLAALAGICFLMGPNLVRSDFRRDLSHLEILKTWPLAGAGLVAAELAVPSLLLAALHWLALGGLLVTMPHAGLTFLDPATRTAILVSLMIVAPAFDLMAVLIQNAAALLLPGWYALGAARARGLEATGQRILTLAMSLIVLAVVAIPAALVGGMIYLLGGGLFGPWALVPAALAVAAVYAGEAMLGMVALGKVYERLDPATEGMVAA